MIHAEEQLSIPLNSIHKIKFCGPHGRYDDGREMPFSEQMAIISHYLHNSTPFAEPNKKKALELMKDIQQAQDSLRKYF
jgi:hypothetical protein